MLTVQISDQYLLSFLKYRHLQFYRMPNFQNIIFFPIFSLYVLKGKTFSQYYSLVWSSNRVLVILYENLESGDSSTLQFHNRHLNCPAFMVFCIKNAWFLLTYCSHIDILIKFLQTFYTYIIKFHNTISDINLSSSTSKV